MKRRGKKALSWLLTLALGLGLLPGVSLTAYAANPVTYLDADGSTQTCTEYTTVTSSTTTWETGWYVVSSNVGISSDNETDRITIGSDQNVKVILCDNKNLEITERIHADSGSSITIYAQSTGSTMGTMTIISSGNYNAFGSSGTLTINGGEVSVTTDSASTECKAIMASQGLTINGGIVKAESAGGSGYGIYSGSDIIINGGSVSAKDDFTGYGIYSTSGAITVNGGSVTTYSEGGHGIYSRDGSVTVNSGTVTATANTTATNHYGIYGKTVTIGTGLTVKAGDTDSSAREVTDFSTSYRSYKYAHIEEATAGGGYTALSDETPVTITNGTQDHNVPVVDDVLTANCDATDIVYQWYRGNDPISGETGITYTVAKDDIGKPITVKVTQTKKPDGTDYAGNERPTQTSGPTASVEKKNGPAAPTDATTAGFVPDYTAETYTVGAAYEVSSTNDDAGTPVTSLTPILDSATPTVYIRVKETDDIKPGAWLPVTLAARPDAPSLTTENAANGSTADGKIKGTTTAMEYKLQDSTGDWTTANATETAVTPGAYLVRTRATNDTPAGKPAEVTVGSKYVPLTNDNKPTISVSNDHNPPQVNDTLTAETTATDVIYQWYRGGDPISGGTGSTYTVAKDDIGKPITVKVTQTKKPDGTDYAGNERPTQTSGPTASVEKKNGPAAPTDATTAGFVPDYTAETYTVGAAYEVSSTNDDAGTPVTTLTPILDGAAPTVYIRVKETNDAKPGAWLPIDLPARPAAPTGLTTEKRDAGKGTIGGMNSTMQYSADNGTTWTDATGDSPVEVPAGTYLVRIKATDTIPAGKTASIKVESSFVALDDSTKPTVIVSDNHNPPVVDDTLTAATTATDVVYEWYRGSDPISGETGSTYTVAKNDIGKPITVKVTQTKKSDGTDYAGNERPTQTSDPTPSVEKKNGSAAPTAPTQDEITKTDTIITVKAPAQSGSGTMESPYRYEYSIDGGATWQDSGEFTGLQPGTDYSVVVREKETDTTQAGQPTAPLAVKTNVTVVITPTDPVQGKKISASHTPTQTGVTCKWYELDESTNPATETEISGATGSDYVPATSGKKLIVKVFKGVEEIGAATTAGPVKSISDYISGLASPATVKLDGPVTGDVTIPAGKDITIDLNGQAITGDITVESDGTLTMNDSSDPDAGKVTGKVTNHGGTAINGGIFEGGVDNDGYTLINDGTFKGTVTNKDIADSSNAVTIMGGRLDKRPIAKTDAIYINGGKFKEDPSKAANDSTTANPHIEIREDKEIVSVEGNDYPYQLADKTATPADIKVDQGETVAEVAETIDDSVKTAAENAAKSTEAGLEDAAVEQVRQIVAASDTVTDENKNIVIVPALEVKAEAYTVDGDNTTMTLDIEAVYTSYETDGSITTAAQVKANENDGSKVKEIGSGKLNTEGMAVLVKVAVANDFAEAMGASTTASATVYVRHTHNSKNFEYRATLAYDGSGMYYVSFTNPNGFSPFTLTKSSSSKAKLYVTGEDRYYTDLQSAIDDAPDGSIITLTDNGDDEVTAVIREAKTITIDKDGHTGAVTIIAASGLKLTATGKGGNLTEYKASRTGGGNTGVGTAAYPLTISEAENGTVTVSPTAPKSGDKVTITPKPDEGYEVDTVTVTDASGKDVAVTDNGDGTYSFTQPNSKVTIDVTFKKVEAPTSDQSCPRDETCPMSAFTDLDPTLWYHDGIHFCIENGMMKGVGDNLFDPGGTTSRGMIVTILYRLENEPEITAENPFDDVEPDTWYTGAVIWAAENKIVDGYGDGTFGPGDPITREQLAAILYRYAQFKGVDVSIGEDTNILDFPDAGECSGWSVSAVQWAVGSGIVGGKDGKLVPTGDASRAEAAAMLQRYCSEIAK